MSIAIRDERPGDRDAVFAINAAAFPTEDEARLVDRLRDCAEPLISLVATDGDETVGHILFTHAELDADALVMGLAPMAVAPERQRQGIGSALVRAGLDRCREIGAGVVIVLGHADYYPRFGFARASTFGVKSEYDVPDEVFMVLELVPGAAAGGTARYHAAFNEL